MNDFKNRHHAKRKVNVLLLLRLGKFMLLDLKVHFIFLFALLKSLQIDMDTLCFGTPVLLRHLTFSEARKLPIVEVHLDVVLKEMNLTMDEVKIFLFFFNFGFIVYRFLDSFRL